LALGYRLRRRCDLTPMRTHPCVRLFCVINALTIAINAAGRRAALLKNLEKQSFSSITTR
jgi:hypothetical protein